MSMENQSLSSHSTWKEELLNSESQRIAGNQSQELQLHEGNRRDDTTGWLRFTKWPQLFEGKNLRVSHSF